MEDKLIMKFKDEQIYEAVKKGFENFEESLERAKKKQAKKLSEGISESPLMQLKPRDFKLWSNRSRGE